MPLMKAASEYRKQAEECRKLAKGMPDGDARRQLVIMAETWERLAMDRESRHPVQPDEAPKAPPEK
jgi:hypothetical protein